MIGPKVSLSWWSSNSAVRNRSRTASASGSDQTSSIGRPSSPRRVSMGMVAADIAGALEGGPHADKGAAFLRLLAPRDLVVLVEQVHDPAIDLERVVDPVGTEQVEDDVAVSSAAVAGLVVRSVAGAQGRLPALIRGHRRGGKGRMPRAAEPQAGHLALGIQIRVALGQAEPAVDLGGEAQLEAGRLGLANLHIGPGPGDLVLDVVLEQRRPTVTRSQKMSTPMSDPWLSSTPRFGLP